MPTRSRHRNLRIYLPTITICATPFLLGAVSPLVLLSLVLCLLTSLYFEFKVKQGLVSPRASYGLLAVLLVAALGLVPLPEAALRALSPVATETRDFVLGGLGAGAAWSPLSFDLPATILATLLCLAVLLAFLVGANISSRKLRWRLSLSLVGGLGGLMAFVVFAHQMNHLSAVYGLFPTQAKLVGPLLNSNHLAAFCSFSALIAIGLALHVANAARPWLVFSALLSLVVVWLAPSRGGLAATLLGLLVLALWELYAWRGAKAALLAAASAVGVAGVGVLLWGGRFAEQTRADLKLQVWADSLSLIDDFFWVGVGRGAFAAVFPRYQSFTQSFTVRSAESLPLSIVSETGILGLLVVLLFGAWFFAALRARPLEPAERGAVVALLMIVIHDLADFSLDLAGVALPVFFVAGVLAGRAEPRRARPLFYCAAALSLVLVPASLWATLRSPARALSQLASAQDAATLQQRAAQELQLRPSDGFLALAAASRMLVLQDPKAAMPYINRARYLLPKHYASHLLAARVLRQFGRLSQARLEYRGAHSDASRGVFREALEIAPGEDEMRQLIADEESPRRALFVALTEAQRAREALNLLWGISQQNKKNADAWSSLGEYALSAQEGEEAEAAAVMLSKLSDKRAPWLLARAKRALGQLDAAEEALLQGTARWPRERALWLRLGEIRLELQHYEAATDAAKKAKQLSAETPDVFLLEARVQEAQGRLQSALGVYQEALRLAPHSPEVRVSLARLYEKLSRSHDALIIYRELAKENPIYQAEVDRLSR